MRKTGKQAYYAYTIYAKYRLKGYSDKKLTFILQILIIK